MSIKSRVSGADPGTGTDIGTGTDTGTVIGTVMEQVPGAEKQWAQVPSQALDEVQEHKQVHAVKQPKNSLKTDEVPAGTGKVVNINQKRRSGTGTELSAGTGKVPTGRPKGAVDKVPRKKRTDSNQLAISPDDRVRILQHTIAVSQIGRVRDRNDPEEIREHIIRYQELCIEYQVLPTVAGVALALGIDRRTLWSWLTNRQGEIKCQEVSDTLKGVYMQINAQYESMLTGGKIIPVAGFFLLQNNFGYENQQTHVITPAAPADPDTNELATRAGLLTDGDPDR